MTELAAASRLRIALVAEAIGTAFLLATAVGSAIMADRLSGGNLALGLLGCSLPTGAMLVVLITMFAPLSGAHFNPMVTLAFALRRDLPVPHALAYGVAQILGAFIGVVVAHLMFGVAPLKLAEITRTGGAIWLSEGIATFGLVLTILLTLRANAAAVPMAVGLYITGAYWFTSSTSFANPAVTLARVFSDSVSGIRPLDAPAFMLAQLAGALAGWALAAWLTHLTKPSLNGRQA